MDPGSRGGDKIPPGDEREANVRGEVYDGVCLYQMQSGRWGREAPGTGFHKAGKRVYTARTHCLSELILLSERTGWT